MTSPPHQLFIATPPKFYFYPCSSSVLQPQACSCRRNRQHPGLLPDPHTTQIRDQKKTQQQQHLWTSRHLTRTDPDKILSHEALYLNCTSLNHLFSLWSNWCTWKEEDYFMVIYSTELRRLHVMRLHSWSVSNTREELWSKPPLIIYQQGWEWWQDWLKMARYSADPLVLLSVKSQAEQVYWRGFALSINNASWGGIETYCGFSAQINHLSVSTCPFIGGKKPHFHCSLFLYIFMSSAGTSHLVPANSQRGAGQRQVKHLEVMWVVGNLKGHGHVTVQWHWCW